MKKIISMCSVILVISLVVTLFAACGNKSENKPSDQSAEVIKGFSVEILEDKAIIKKDGESYQEIFYPRNSGIDFDIKYAKEHNQFIDMNFDGEKDFYLAANNINGDISYFAWLYNASTKKFDFSVILSALKNISIDSDNQLILSINKVDGEEVINSYKWVDGSLTYVETFDNEDNKAPEDITNAADSVIGSNNKPVSSTKPISKPNKGESTTGEKPVKPDNKPTKPAKPAKPNLTTTTTPNNEGVQIGDGNFNDGWF